MYTTLDFLKSNDACPPGFGRMLRFFGTRFDRFERIPLHVVSLVGGFTDATWVLSSALIIDQEDYRKFRARTLVPMMRKVLRGTSAFEKMCSIAQAEKLPFASGAKTRKSAKNALLYDGMNMRQKFEYRVHKDMWHILGFDNEKHEAPPMSEVQEYIDFILSIPEEYVSHQLNRLLAKPPREYISQVFESYRTSFIDRNGSSDSERLLLCDETSGSDGYILAKVLEPENTLRFMSTMDYKPRISTDVNIERTETGRVRVVHEFDIESLDYLSILRMQTDRSAMRYRDQDTQDSENLADRSYPEYVAVPVEEDGQTIFEYQPRSARTLTTRNATSRTTREEDEDEDDEEDADFA